MFENLKPDPEEPQRPSAGFVPGQSASEESEADALEAPPPKELKTESYPDDLAPFMGEEEGEELDAVEDAREDEVEDWKAALREEFEHWLETLDQVPEPENTEDVAEDPDLYSFYEELATANAESRKANRRTAEAISQWGDVLGRFEAGLAPLRETVAQLAAAQPKEGKLLRAHCLMLIELLDRLRRIERAFNAPPPAKSSWWNSGVTSAWRQAWETQRQAFGIVSSHLEELLKREGVRRFETLGQLFDPSRMTAVAAEPDASRPPHTVIEEIVPGYLRDGELLRPAQVKVTRQP